jgi:hypothetical protein
MALMSYQCEREHRTLQHVLCFLSLICLRGIPDNGCKDVEAFASDFTSLRVNARFKVDFVSLPKCTRGIPQPHNDFQQRVLRPLLSTSGDPSPKASDNTLSKPLTTDWRLLIPKSKLRSVSQYVLVSSTLVGLATRYYFLSECCSLKFAVLLLWAALS